MPMHRQWVRVVDTPNGVAAATLPNGATRNYIQDIRQSMWESPHLHAGGSPLR